jgi:hypothetical protein
VLQAGAFFGALGSAPISNWIGRRWTLVIFMLIFSLGAASILYRGHRRFITYMHTDIDHSGWGRPWLRLHIWRSCYIGSWNRWHIGRSSCLCLRMFPKKCPCKDHWSFPNYGSYRCNDFVFHQL